MLEAEEGIANPESKQNLAEGFALRKGWKSLEQGTSTLPDTLRSLEESWISCSVTGRFGRRGKNPSRLAWNIFFKR